MSNDTRILFVAGEVAPFAEVTDIADLTRKLPEQLLEAGSYDTRIMMPRYGTISERRNRLHEVIRLSGNDIPMGDETENLKVKVASIPGIRLQVYFMDNKTYFKRKGVYSNKQDVVYEDNAARALYFGSAVLETIRKLRWGPDIVHTFGWMSSLVPLLLQTAYADDELFAKAKLVHTPDASLEPPVQFTDEGIQQFGLPDPLAGKPLNDVAMERSDAVLALPGHEAPDEAHRFGDDAETYHEEAAALYEQLLGVPA